MASAQVNNIAQYGGLNNPTSPTIVLPGAGGGIGDFRFLMASVFASTYVIDHYLGFYSMSAPAVELTQYIVPAGKKLYVTGIHYGSSSGSNPNNAQFGYGDALVANNTATAPTNNVRYGATGSATTTGIMLEGGATAFIPSFYAYPLVFPENFYPWVRLSSAAATSDQILLTGYEF